MKIVLRYYRMAVAYGGMTALGLTVATLRYASFGLLISFNRGVLVPAVCRLLLRLCGVRVDSRLLQKAWGGPRCYVFNHNSYLDLFLVPLLGLPRTRAIITEGVKKTVPLHLCNLGIHVLYIPDSHKTAERIAFFRAVSADLRSGRYSVVCSPEGRHDFLRRIAPFNRGVFHMAMAADVEIEMIFFDIPEAIDPLESFDMRRGTVTLRSLGRVNTSEWTEDELPRHIAEVRRRYIDELTSTEADR